jgi:hypothetical protein
MSQHGTPSRRRSVSPVSHRKPSIDLSEFDSAFMHCANGSRNRWTPRKRSAVTVFGKPLALHGWRWKRLLHVADYEMLTSK